ncbi:MAG: SIS domain-containing protein [Spartobacteria bacterium]|nr:SIS domain-containing protein [Spartobacteria bacterium]
METWTDHVNELSGYLHRMEGSDRSGKIISADNAFKKWRDFAARIREKRATIHLIGNGASASMASHFAADIAKNAGIRTNVFSDLSLITALGNDLGYDKVFSEPLRQHADTVDLLVAISSSGRSPNILEAVRVAREKGLVIVTLSGMHAENPLRQQGDLNIYVAARSYGHVETCHAALLHHWMDTIEQKESSHALRSAP